MLSQILNSDIVGTHFSSWAPRNTESSTWPISKNAGKRMRHRRATGLLCR